MLGRVIMRAGLISRLLVPCSAPLRSAQKEEDPRKGRGIPEFQRPRGNLAASTTYP